MGKPSSLPPDRPTYRTVVEQPRFTAEAAALTKNAERLDVAIDGIKWYVSRMPGSAGVSQETVKSGVWAISTVAWNTVPCIVYYSFNAHEVYLESILVGEVGEES